MTEPTDLPDEEDEEPDVRTDPIPRHPDDPPLDEE